MRGYGLQSGDYVSSMYMCDFIKTDLYILASVSTPVATCNLLKDFFA